MRSGNGNGGEATKEQVNHPDHYNQVTGIECIDVAENFGFNLGNAMKYIWRSDHKDAPVEDLKKAAWYIQREIDRRLDLQAREHETMIPASQRDDQMTRSSSWTIK